MEIRLLTTPDDLARYDRWVKSHPDGTLWQSLEWKQFQESLGRTVKIYAAMEGAEIQASALVVIDRTTGGLRTWEVPRGPLGRMENGEWRMENLISLIIEDARKDHCISVYLSPSVPFSILHSPLSISGRYVMPEATRILDLTLSDDDLLAQMKPKGRYNIGLAQRHGVRVERSENFRAYAALAEQTARRDGFQGHSGTFYKHFLSDLPGSFLLLAYPNSESDLKPIAGLLGVVWGMQDLPADLSPEAPRAKGEAPAGAKVGIYYYGASGNEHRELMAPYLLQWKAMQYCQAQGCTSYDLFGIAPDGQPDHPWAGVSEFKSKFGGQVINYPPEEEITLRPFAKNLLKMKRKIT